MKCRNLFEFGVIFSFYFSEKFKKNQGIECVNISKYTDYSSFKKQYQEQTRLIFYQNQLMLFF
jgi:hypothetical protein